MFPSIMIVDDEPSILQSLSGLLIDEGFEVTTASNGYEALKQIAAEAPDLVLLDIWMPGIDGIETLQEIKKENPSIQVIIISGHGTIETAVRATKLGAFDFIEKPLSIDRVIVAINNALNFRRIEEENRYLRKKMLEKHSLTGSGRTVGELKKQIAMAAPTDKNILITGENGTGKELVARTIHQLSQRSQGPLVDVNCAAIPEDLFESELFGHEKGAFTGVTTKKSGKFELADKGTIFFDEISDLSLKMQGKLLRVLQEKTFQRLGGSRVMTVDTRVIAASNRSLEREMQQGRFREDLYYRLKVIPIRVPSLRERKEDIPALAACFLEESAKMGNGLAKRISPEAMAVFQAYDWPGNARELKNIIERLTIMVESEQIEAAHLTDLIGSCAGQSTVINENSVFAIDNYAAASKEFEQRFIQIKMSQLGNDLQKAAKMLGVSQDFLQQKLVTMQGVESGNEPK